MNEHDYILLGTDNQLDTFSHRTGVEPDRYDAESAEKALGINDDTSSAIGFLLNQGNGSMARLIKSAEEIGLKIAVYLD